MKKLMPCILGFSEADMYFWVTLGILLGRMRETTYCLSAARPGSGS